MVCHKMKSSELSEKYSSATLKSLKKRGQILLWKSVFMTKSVMHIVTRARCFLCSGSDYSKQKFKAHLPHQLQILPWWCREGEEQGWDPPHPGGFRWDFYPPSPWASLNPHSIPGSAFPKTSAPPNPLLPLAEKKSTGWSSTPDQTPKSPLALFPFKPSMELL